jgi:hypothetical protein
MIMNHDYDHVIPLGARLVNFVGDDKGKNNVKIPPPSEYTPPKVIGNVKIHCSSSSIGHACISDDQLEFIRQNIK